jgi:hypothetical protein
VQPGGVGPFGGLDRLRLRLRLGNRNRNRNCNSNSNSNSNSQNTETTDYTKTTRISPTSEGPARAMGSLWI